MGKFKGTKGKWGYEIVSNSICRISVIDYSFAEVYLSYNSDEIIEMEANALLISKAPEMLEMLESLENDNGAIPKMMWDKIQRLIKEATTI